MTSPERNDRDGAASALSPVDFDPFAGGALIRTAPATALQKELWTASQMGPDASCAFNECQSLVFEGPLDERALEGALLALGQRHEALRTTLSPDGELLCVSDAAEVAFEVVDGTAAGDAERQARLEAEVTTPFDLERGPLWRATLVRGGPDRHELILTAHHIVCDGYSIGVLLRELGALYTAAHRGEAAELPEAVPYSVYADHLATRDETRAMTWWRARFAGRPPRLDLPTDKPRPPMRSFESAREDRVLPPDLMAGLERLGAKHGASLFVTLFAAWNTLLARMSGQDDLVVNVPSAGQPAFGADRLVGHCVHSLPLRLHVDAEASFADLLRATRGVVLDAFEHQEVTFGELLRALELPRDPSRIPVASVQFNLDRALEGPELGFEGLEVRFVSNPRRFESFELFLNVMRSARGLLLECQYATQLFEGETIRDRLAGFETLCRAAVAEPDAPLHALPILSPAERERVLSTWNQTAVPVPGDQTLHGLILAQAERTPERVAARAGTQELTYRDLAARARRLARHLRGLGVGPGVAVGLATARDLDMLVGALGILEAGGAYVPIDPEYPADRIAWVLERSRAPVVITQAALEDALPPGTYKRVRMDADAAAIAAQDDAPLAPLAGPGDRAYIIFTSGSTGRAKGVPVPHGAVVNFLQSMARTPGLGPDDVLVAVTTLAFDMSVPELYLPLTVGARVVIAASDVAADGRALAALLDEAGATVLQGTPSTFRLLLAAGWQGRPQMVAIAGGEAFGSELAQAVMERTAAFYNGYGPTEATVYATIHKLERSQAPIPIGRPLDNLACYVLDPHRQPVPVGTPGELYVGGLGVAEGYLEEPAMTAERFVANPFGAGRLYRTGDVVRWLRDGTLVFERRIDTQVKVRGYRIELGEVETVLAEHPAVAQAVANVYVPADGDARLAAYVALRPDHGVEMAALREHLRKKLPAYMVPQHLVRLERIPLTPNGKADRKALPAPDLSAREQLTPFVAPRTPTERAVAHIWSQVLGVARVGVDDDFFELGGHSILATRVIARLVTELGVELPLRWFFASSTLGALAERVEALQLVGKAPAASDDGDREELEF
ncbi:MAG: amino acid adenylation domain-containing protein [Deltaproteobacteria bacterium]|nr:amino acid adenylation domain-containing protein [Deltaproteobacteria bacterium]